MPRIIPAVLLALLVLTAGCTGVLGGPATDAPDETTDPDLGDGAVGPEPSVVGAPAVDGGGSVGMAVDGFAAEGAAAYADARSSLGFAPSYGGSASLGEAGTVTVSGTGQASADPDRAIVYVAVEARADTAAAARDQVAADAAGVRDALRELGIPDEDVRTTHYAIYPRYDYRDDRRELLGYVATHAYEVRVGADQAGETIDAAVDGGATQVNGVQFTLSEDKQRELRSEAVTAAVEDARADADAIAAATGVTITGVHAASTSGPFVVPYAGRMAAAEDGATTIESGPVTVSAAVTVAYTVE